MDPSLLDYYNSELAYMRQMAGDFAAAHPKVARRLGMQGMDVADPFVERLIEAFCFLSARTRLRLEAEFPRFTQRLLEVLYPNYVAPTPSMAVVRLEPGTAEGDLASGFVLPRGTLFRTPIPSSQQTACRFRSGMDTVLWPLELVEARLGPPPADCPPSCLPSCMGVADAGPEADRGPQGRAVRAALHLRLRTLGGVPFSALRGLDRLPFHLAGDEEIATRLFELLHAGAVGLYANDPGLAEQGARVVVADPIELEGFGAEQSLLPLPWNAFHGHNLVHEYCACPARFLFLALRGLGACLSSLRGTEAELVILLDRAAPSLVPVTDATRFALFCTPVINLFPMRTDRVEVHPGLAEFHVVPDKSRPTDFEIHSIQQVLAYHGQSGEELAFRPLYETLGTDSQGYGRYFSVRRERRRLSDRTRTHGAQAGHIGTEVFLSLVDQFEAPWAEDITTLSVRVLATNRELPRLLPPAGLRELTLSDAAPVRRATFLRFPTRPRPPYADRELAWRLIRYLSLNFLTLEASAQEDGGHALRDFLGLMCPPDLPEIMAQIQSLVGCSMSPVTRRLPGIGPIVYGRGVRCALMVDESGFSGGTPYLFGLVLSRFLSRHASINTFVETELHTPQRGRIARWHAVKGGRAIL